MTPLTLYPTDQGPADVQEIQATSASSDGKCELVMDICSKNCMPFYVMENPSVSKLKEKFIKIGFYFENKDSFEVKKMFLSSEPLKELVEVRKHLDKYMKEGKLS